MIDDYKVYLINLPVKVKGFVHIDETGFASIYINAALSYRDQKAVFWHEIKHLRYGDMFSARSIIAVERRR